MRHLQIIEDRLHICCKPICVTSPGFIISAGELLTRTSCRVTDCTHQLDPKEHNVVRSVEFRFCNGIPRLVMCFSPAATRRLPRRPSEASGALVPCRNDSCSSLACTPRRWAVTDIIVSVTGVETRLGSCTTWVLSSRVECHGSSTA